MGYIYTIIIIVIFNNFANNIILMLKVGFHSSNLTSLAKIKEMFKEYADFVN